jgi:peptidoglycan/LPS O-acetylase OafA/YrhL
MSTDANALELGGRPRLGHIAGLDGVRALSVLGIIAFHNGLSSVPGGFYGVDSFFVLSGYLITSLLVTEWSGSGTIRLRRFWAGRARRLLPALFLLVATIGVVLAVAPSLLATNDIVGDAVSTIFYASNWYSIHNGVSYFSLASQPSPLLHTWSLAIEEQFYLVWPLVVLAVLTRWTGRSGRGRRQIRGRVETVPVLDGGQVTLLPFEMTGRTPEWIRRRRLHGLFLVASLGALASALLMAFMAPNGYTTRAYYGTDTRAQALLVGAALATGLTLWKSATKHPNFVRLAWGLGLIGLVGTGLLWATVNEASTFAFSGGFLMASLCAAMVVLCAVVAPRSLTVRLLELPPLPALGRISYGVYLWYWPVLLVMSGSRLHWGVYPLFGVRVAVTVVIAALSAHYVELPIRRGALSEWRSWVAGPVGAAVAIGAVYASTLVPVGATVLQTVPTTTTTPTTGSTGSTTPGQATTTVPLVPTGLTPAPPTVTPTAPVKVLLVGDSIAGSLGVGLVQGAGARNIQIVNEGIPGCSLSMAQQIKVLFYTLAPGAPCSSSNPDALFALWQKWVDAYNPDVVLYVARGETFDQEVGGQWENLGEPAFDRYVAGRYREAVKVLGSRGATVVLMTSPYYDSGTSPSGSIWPEDQASRVEIDNQTMRTVAGSMTTGDGSSAGNQVYVFDLNQVVSPGDQFASSVGSVNVRCTDGVHFSRSGGTLVGQELLPDLAVLGQAHAKASPGGAWSGRLPASTPSWYPKLPCP